MTLRDRSHITAFAILFAAVSIASLASTVGPTGPVGSPGPVGPTADRYVEGVLGHATNASPFGARSAADRDLVALLFRGLVRLGPDQTIVGDLASSWESDPSGSAWTFHLRPGLQWQDGAPLTADDVVFTIKALSEPDYDGPGGASWSEVTPLALDPLTVALRLETPLGGFLQAATQPIAPAHLLRDVPVRQLSTDPFGQRPIGSGAFRLLVLDANRAVLDPVAPESPGVDATASTGATGPAVGTTPPDAGLPAPYLPGIQFEYFDDVAAMQAAWDRGELDGASGLAPADTATIAANPGVHVVRYPSSTLYAVVLNLRAGAPRFADPAVRKALLEAIDRNAVLADPLLGFGRVAEALIPPWAPEFDPSVNPTVPFDPTAAKAGLVAAGWRQTDTSWVPKGASEPVSLTIVSADPAGNAIAYAIADAVAGAWRSIGLKVSHEAVPAADLLTGRLQPGQFDAAILPLVIGLDPDLYPLLASSQTRTGGTNVSGLQDQTLDHLLVAARAPGLPEQRLAAYRALEQRLSVTLPILPLAFRDEVVVLRDTVSGPTPRPIGDPGERFWDVLTWRLAEAPTSS